MTFDSIYHKMYSKIFFKWVIQQINFYNKTYIKRESEDEKEKNEEQGIK